MNMLSMSMDVVGCVRNETDEIIPTWGLQMVVCENRIPGIQQTTRDGTIIRVLAHVFCHRGDLG
jgi:hypothetical protein